MTGRGALIVLVAALPLRATAGPPISDADLLDLTQAQSCAYILQNRWSSPQPGFPDGRTMIADTDHSGGLCSAAATGMALVACAIANKRAGSTPNWTIPAAQARSIASSIMDTVLEMQANRQSSWNGVPYHFLVMGVTPNSPFVRASGSEVSSVDGALLVAGALTAGQAFGGDLRDKALRIAANVKWYAFLISTPGGIRYSMAWKPESGNGFSIPAQGGYLTTVNWDRPTDEMLVIGILALGNTPGNVNALKAMYSWPRVTRAYRATDGQVYPVVNSYFGSLFSYTQLHGLVPFDVLGKDHPADVGSSVPAVDWWENSVLAAKASRAFSADHAPGQTPSDGYATHTAFGPDSWGLTAAYDPSNLSNYLGNLGAPPREANGGAPEPQGVIAPYGAISCLRLLRAAPDEALSNNPAFRALRHYYDTRFDTLWGAYGPKDAFNDAGQVANIYVGIDTLLQAIAIEDYRTGNTHRWFTSSPPVADGLAVLFHKGLAPGDPDLDGETTPADAVLLLRIAGGLEPAAPSVRYNGDMDGDGRITVNDATRVMMRAVSEP